MVRMKPAEPPPVYCKYSFILMLLITYQQQIADSTEGHVLLEWCVPSEMNLMDSSFLMKPILLSSLFILLKHPSDLHRALWSSFALFKCGQMEVWETWPSFILHAGQHLNFRCSPVSVCLGKSLQIPTCLQLLQRPTNFNWQNPGESLYLGYLLCSCSIFTGWEPVCCGFHVIMSGE